MGNANIPDDWTGDYKDYIVRWPFSEQWDAILRGQLTAPAFTDFWDLFSGDPATSVGAMDETFDTNLHLEEGIVLPSGFIMDYAGITIPDGWLECDGSEVSRTVYAKLFAAIGTIYGSGDGSTTFELPSTRGRVNVALDNTDSDFNSLGEFRGQKNVTLEVSEIPSHGHLQDSHTHTQNSHTHLQNQHNHVVQRRINTTGFASNIWAAGNAVGTVQSDFVSDMATAVNQSTTPTNQNTTATNQEEGGGQSHNNIQPSIVFYRLIKV